MCVRLFSYIHVYVCILCKYLFLFLFTDVPDAVMNVTISDEDTTSESFVVLWNEVMDIFNITCNITWYNESGIVGMDTVNSPPYTVTGLTANTSYNVTVVGINTCCGAGPVSDVVVAMTNDEPPTSPPSPSLTTLSPTPSATPGKIYSYYKYVLSVD